MYNILHVDYNIEFYRYTRKRKYFCVYITKKGNQDVMLCKLTAHQYVDAKLLSSAFDGYKILCDY